MKIHRLTSVKSTRLVFGDYVEARNPHVKSNDPEIARTDSAIALWIVGTLKEKLETAMTTGVIIVQSQLLFLPITNLVIVRVNELYRIDEGSLPNRGARGVNVAAATRTIKQTRDAVTAKTKAADTVLDLIDPHNDNDALPTDSKRFWTSLLRRQHTVQQESQAA